MSAKTGLPSLHGDTNIPKMRCSHMMVVWRRPKITVETLIILLFRGVIRKTGLGFGNSVTFQYVLVSKVTTVFFGNKTADFKKSRTSKVIWISRSVFLSPDVGGGGLWKWPSSVWSAIFCPSVRPSDRLAIRPFEILPPQHHLPL